MLYKYNLRETVNSKTYGEIELPIEELERCYILREYREDITVRSVNLSDHYMSIHFQYTDDGEKGCVYE